MKALYTLLVLLIPFVGLAQLTYIPDDNFEQALIDLGYDEELDDYVLTENIDEVTSLNIGNKNITNLTGIESFSSLIYLEASVNNLSEINLSQNIWLEQLSLGFNNLQNIDLSNNLSLRFLYINDNILSNLFFVSSNQLELLHCQNNFLTSLELSSNINLKYLNCSYNFLSFLNLSTSETGIIELDCNDNQLSNLFDNQPFFDGFPNLTTLNCFNNQLDSLNLNNSTSLTNLNCSNNNLLSLNISGSTSLLDINFNDNQLTTLNVSNNNYLENFEGENNQLISLDFNNHPLLQNLNCNSNLLTSLNINSCLALTSLNCNNNELTEIDIQYNPSIYITNANNNQITNFITNNNYNLQYLDLHNNQLSSIDLNNLYNIKHLVIQNNNYNYLELYSLYNLELLRVGSPNLISLDLGDNYYLKNLKIYGSYDYLNDDNISFYYTPLTSIILKNNNNEIMEMLDFSGAGEYLLCIEVDDVDFCYQNYVWNNAINDINGFLINTESWPTTIYNEDCNSSFGCTDSLACNYNSTASLNDGSCYNTLDVNLDYNNVSCNGGNDGSANVSVNNGSFPYIINWSVSDFNEFSISGLMADSYSLTVTDNDGCSTNEILFNINEPPIISSEEILYSCDSIIYNGIYYQSVQNFVDTLISSNGCDSLLYTSLIPNYVTESFSSISAYLFYDFNGDTIYQSGEYSTTLLNTYGCDSIININIEIIEASWNCINNACVDPMDGSGNYNDINECEDDCNVVIEETWNCINDACVEQIGATGTYQSIQECNDACNLFSFCSDFSNIEEIGYQFYPDTIENINSANVNEYYEQNIQFLTPENIGDVFGDPYYLNSIMINIAPLPIDSIEFVEILGLPDSFEFEFSNFDGIYEPNTLGCLKIFGTPNNSDIGDHNLTILLNGWLNANLIGTIDFYETLGEYEEVNGYVLTVNSFESWSCSANGCYDPQDGSGEYQSLEECQANCFAFGCTDPDACNFDPLANINDFSCEYPIELYDCNGNCLNDINQNGICDELDITGCNDDGACNYNSNATILDSCIYPEPGYDCSGEYQCDEDIVVIYETQDPSCQEANDGWLYIVDISGPDGIEILNDIAVYNSDNEYISNYNNLSSGNYYFTVTSQIHQCSETFQFGLQVNELNCEIIGESTVQNGPIEEYFYYLNYNNSNISTNLIVQGGDIVSSEGNYIGILWDIQEGENGFITVETFNQYSEGNFCENECTFIVSLPAISYNCNDNGCYDPQDGSGEYQSLEECQANCNLELTYIPDDNFEQKLINLGYDNVMDDYVITNNINTLTYLNIGDSQISDLTGIEDFTQLTYLHCSNNELTDINLSQNQQLVDLYCNDNQLTELNLSQNSLIVNLYCSDNELTNLDVSQNTLLVNLYCSNNELISLDVSQNAGLTNLNCGTNLLTSLDLSQNTLLTNLYCSNNQIISLNVNLNTQLTKLYCGSNNLIDLDISQNTLLNSLICLNNSSLYCIKVFDVGFANNSFTFIDSQHYFSIDCFENWSCINESCVDPMDGTGIYQSLEECEANCNITIPDSWNCIDNACIDPLDGTGIYQSFDVCESECENISSLSETLIDINIFPNPSSNIFNLEYNSDSESKILVTNILGEQIYYESNQSFGKYNTQIDLSDFSKGIYNLTIKTSYGISNYKLILQ